MNGPSGQVPTGPSVRTDPPDSSRPKRLRPSGGYRQLRSFQTATILYDATVKFCARFVDPRSRTTDQMTQAARSGRQNIAEGSRAAAISSQTELRLVQMARASLDELLLDCKDFLRQRQLPTRDKNSPEAKAARAPGFPHPSNPPDLADPSDPTGPPQARAPDCPRCGKPMALRTARKGPNTGAQFWGCPAFPTCQGARPLEP